jgi:hypothetical protein
MAYVYGGYVCKSKSGPGPIKFKPNIKKTFFVKFKNPTTGVIRVSKSGQIYLPKEYMGKKVQIKVEVVKEEGDN